MALSCTSTQILENEAETDMRKWIVAFVGGVLVLCMIGVFVWLAGGRGARDPGWGQGKLKASEIAYYISEVDDIANAWRTMTSEAKRVADSRPGEAPFICLAVDIAGNRLWLECDGHPLSDHQIELPSRMEWKLRRSTAQGAFELGPLCRLRIRESQSAQRPLEQVSLIGKRDTQDETESLYFEFTPSGDCIRGHSPSLLITGSSPTQQATAVKTSESMVVDERDYEQVGVRLNPEGSSRHEPSAPTESRAAWKRVKERLCQEIERRILAQGLNLMTFELTRGPNCTSASADVQTTRNTIHSIIRLGSAHPLVHLQIDSLGNDVWYVRSTLHPLYPTAREKPPKMEFLVCATGQIARKDRSRLLAEGRQKQQTGQSQETKP